MKHYIERKSLKLAHRFTISRGGSDVKHNLFVTLTHQGLSGHGEAAPNSRYNETPESAEAALYLLARALPSDLIVYDPLIRSLDEIAPGEYAAKAAMDMAILDWAGKALNAPLHRLWGMDPEHLAPTSMTIAIDKPAAMAERARQASNFPILKIKLGTGDDRAIIRAIRRVTQQKIQVDANEAWPDREHALREIEWLAGQNVVLVEQPLPADRIEDMIWLKQKSALPLIADESFTHYRDLLHIQDGFHGVNIKLMKCGGILAAREAAILARSLGLKVMFGCMIESSLGIAAAAQIAPMADYLDLDGNLLITNDPFNGHPVRDGRICLNDQPGLGVTPKA